MHPNTSYVVRSQYHMQLQQFLHHYPREQILVLRAGASFRHDRGSEPARCSSFVGVDPDFRTPASTASATRRRARRAPPGSRRGWSALSTLPAAAACCRRRCGCALDARLPLRKPIERPDVREALPDEVLRVLREDAERLREATGRTFEHWSIWS